jgi:hypothetical protein
LYAGKKNWFVLGIERKKTRGRTRCKRIFQTHNSKTRAISSKKKMFFLLFVREEEHWVEQQVKPDEKKNLL